MTSISIYINWRVEQFKFAAPLTKWRRCHLICRFILRIETKKMTRSVSIAEHKVREIHFVQSWLRNSATLLNFGRLQRKLGITCSFVTLFRRNWHHLQDLGVLYLKSFGRNSIRPSVRPQTAHKEKTKEERRAFSPNLRLNEQSDFNRLKRKSVELIEGYRLVQFPHWNDEKTEIPQRCRVEWKAPSANPGRLIN